MTDVSSTCLFSPFDAIAEHAAVARVQMHSLHLAVETLLNCPLLCQSLPFYQCLLPKMHKIFLYLLLGIHRPCAGDSIATVSSIF